MIFLSTSVLAVSCSIGEHAVVSFLSDRKDLLVIPVVETTKPLHVQVGLRLKKIIELVKHVYASITLIPSN